MSEWHDEFTEGQALALLRDPLLNAVLTELEKVAVETAVNTDLPDDRLRLVALTRVKALRSVREAIGRIAEPDASEPEPTQIVS